MNRSLTLGSLFDGSGGFPLAGLLAGIVPVWSSEIEPFAIRVTEKRLEVFDALEYNIDNNITTKGEIQLTDALDKVRETSGIMGFVFNGKVFDVGTPEMYRDTIMNYGM